MKLTIIKDLNKISENQSAFYETLYSEKINQNKPCYNYNLKIFLQNNDIPKLSDTQNEFCEKPVSQIEILKSIKSLFNGHTPGTDGLSADWYKFFWIDIKNMPTDSITYALITGNLSIEQKRGIITLLPKKNKNRLQLKKLETHKLIKYRFTLCSPLRCML